MCSVNSFADPPPLLRGADICKETQLRKEDAVTPVNWLPNVAIHLSGPSRTLGAIIIGSSGEGLHLSCVVRAIGWLDKIRDDKGL